MHDIALEESRIVIKADDKVVLANTVKPYPGFDDLYKVFEILLFDSQKNNVGSYITGVCEGPEYKIACKVLGVSSEQND